MAKLIPMLERIAFTLSHFVTEFKNMNPLYSIEARQTPQPYQAIRDGLIRLCIALVLLMLCGPSSHARAQDVPEIGVRSGVHPGYARLVFDWMSPSDYTVHRQGSALTVAFSRPATANLNTIAGEEIPNISNVKVVSSSGAPLEISLTVPEKSRVRDFRAGSRVVIDIYNPDGKERPVPSTAPSKQEKKPEEPQTTQTTKETQPPKPQEQSRNQDVEEKTLSPEERKTVEKTVLPPPDIDPHVITVTGTRAVGMSVFERAGWLWMILDNPDVTVPPQLSGPQKDRFKDFERVSVQGGTAFGLPLPEGLNVYGEGGGLLWRVVLSPNPRSTAPAGPEIEFADGERIRGGTVFWPLSGVRRTLEMKDPRFNDTVKIVTVEDSSAYAGPSKLFPEMRTLDSIIGLAFVPKTDDMELENLPEGVMVTRPGGLALSRPRDTLPPELRKQAVQERNEHGKHLPPPEEETVKTAEEPKLPPMSRIYNFKGWEMGGVRALEENQRILMASIAAADREQQVEDLLTLAKLNLANNRNQESLGFLRVAAQVLPGIERGVEYTALHAAAAARAARYDTAIHDLAVPALKDYGELDYWRAVTLAGLEDWQQAADIMPDDFTVLADYPPQIYEPLGLVLTEIALRGGQTEKAEELLAFLETRKEQMSPPHAAAWAYLMGELQRQQDEPERAIEYWTPLIEGKDDLYRAKAGLSLTRLELERGDITPAQAIDRLEGLRYAWRGDELETLINFRLGQVYIDNGNYLKGLSVLRNAASFSPDSHMAREVTAYMTKAFRNLFTGKGVLGAVPPLEAISIYDEFRELTPAGAEGDSFIAALAEHLVDADLLGRAAELLENQVTHRLEGADAAETAIRLAAIRLLDDKPEGALQALKTAEARYMEQPDSKPEEDGAEEEHSSGRAIPPEKLHEIKLLRARALSELNRSEESLAVLSDMELDKDVSRLKADVAWSAGSWQDAAEAFQDLIVAEDLSLTRPLTPYQTDLILNRAIALNLAGNRVGLTNLRERYGDAMKQTEKAQMFEIVTRPRQMGLLGGNQSIRAMISEIDLFGEFMENYRKAVSEKPEE